jgi:integrase
MSLVSVPLPNLQEDRNLVLERVLLNGVSNEHTRRAYRRALGKFLAWYDARGYAELSRQVLFDYRTWSEASGAAPSSTNVELAALRRLFRKAAEAGLVDWGKAEAAAGVDNRRSSGVRVGNWLTPEQAKSLLLAPDENTRRGKRDGALLGLLVGCALRRSELVSLAVDKIQNARRSLGDSRSRRQAQEASHGAGSGLGKRPARSLERRGEDHGGEAISSGEKERQGIGRLAQHDGGVEDRAALRARVGIEHLVE